MLCRMLHMDLSVIEQSIFMFKWNTVILSETQLKNVGTNSLLKIISFEKKYKKKLLWRLF